MPKQRSWADEQLIEAVRTSYSYRGVITKLKLIPTGSNYDQVRRRIHVLGLAAEHFTGMGWNIGGKFLPRPAASLETLLTRDVDVQSFKLKIRLFAAGLKTPQCWAIGWAQKSADGRIPVELDHINGDKRDNRLENLRIICPNCHSLQPTRRGRNKKVHLRYARVAER